MEATILYLVLYTLVTEFWNDSMHLGPITSYEQIVSINPPKLGPERMQDGSKLINAGTVYINELAWNEQYRMKETVRHVTLKDYKVFKIDTKKLTINPYSIEQVHP